MIKDWEFCKIENISKTSSGGTPNRKILNYYKGKIRWFTTSELSQKYLYDSNEHITEKAIENSSAKLFKKETILLAMYGATIGKVSILKADATTNQACCAIMPYSNYFNEYIYYQLVFNKKNLINLGCGAGQPNISQKIIKDFSIICPKNKDEQIKIATVLSNIDLLIHSLEKLIGKKKLIKQGVMQELLTGKKRLPGFNKEWSLESNIFKFVKGKQVSHQELDGFGKYKMYNGGISFSGLYPDYNYEDKIIISEGGNSCGFVNYIKTKFWAGGHCYVIISCDLDKEFLYQLLKFNQNKIMSLRVGSGLPNIQAKNLSKMNFYFPTSKQEQIEIGKILTDMDEEINSLEQDLEKYKNIKQGMMEQLLTGKIRVV